MEPPEARASWIQMVELGEVAHSSLIKTPFCALFIGVLYPFEKQIPDIPDQELH